jgi:hypothetical protein
MTESKYESMRGIVLKVIDEAGDAGASKAMLRKEARQSRPDLCDNEDRCCAGINHPRWEHILDRSVFDLRKMGKIESVPGHKGWYQLKQAPK